MSGSLTGSSAQQVLRLNGYFFGPGRQFGNAGGWRGSQLLHLEGYFATSGISQGINCVMFKWSTGDNACFYGYVNTDLGTSAPSDEGAENSFQVQENPGYFHGTVRDICLWIQ